MPDLAFDLRHLRYAVLVAEHGSFRRAANVLNLSQSTLSRRVQQLERRLGTQLFERDRTGARPTVAGARFMREASIGADHLRRAIQEISATQRGQAGELRIGLLSSLAGGFLARLLEAFRSRYPDVELHLEEAATRDNIAGVKSGRLDVAFVPGNAPVDGFENRCLWQEPLYIVVPERHPLSQTDAASWPMLRDQRFVVATDAAGPEIEDLLLRQLSSLGFRPDITAHRVGRENLISMVGLGFGITLAAEPVRGAAYAGVRFIPFAGRGEVVQTSAIWSPSNKNPLLKRMLALASALRPVRRAPT